MEDNDYIKGKIIETYQNIHNLNFDAIDYDDENVSIVAINSFASRM